MALKGVARVQDYAVCPICGIEGPIITGSPDTIVNDKFVARQDDTGTFIKLVGGGAITPVQFIITRATGSGYANSKRVARQGDEVTEVLSGHKGYIATSSVDTFMEAGI